jgi:hypothetical protein
MGKQWILGRFAVGFRVDPVGSCKYGDEPAASGATELVV